jgi:hypothetical protein
MKVGKEFSGITSETLQESLQKQCLAYFNAYHRSRLDELRTHLENEGWALCPVKPNFNIRSLAEFAHLKMASLRSPSKKVLQGERAYFTEFWEAGTPFDDALLDSTYEEDILLEGHGPDSRSDSEEEEDLSEEQKQEILNENEEPNSSLATLKSRVWSPPPPKHGLCLANTTLMLLRLFGRYTNLARLLHPIAEEILRGMTQVFQYYVYAVHVFFVHEPGVGEESDTLKQFVESIFNTVIRHQVEASTPGDEGNGTGDRQQHVGLVMVPQISPAVSLNRWVVFILSISTHVVKIRWLYQLT